MQRLHIIINRYNLVFGLLKKRPFQIMIYKKKYEEIKRKLTKAYEIIFYNLLHYQNRTKH